VGPDPAGVRARWGAGGQVRARWGAGRQVRARWGAREFVDDSHTNARDPPRGPRKQIPITYHLITGIGVSLQGRDKSSFLLENHKEITESFAFVDQHFGGVLPLAILITVPTKAAASAVTMMAAAEQELREIDGLSSVISAAALILEAERMKP